MVSRLCQAQYSNHQLYQAYLNQDVTIWGEYIASCKWDSLKVEEKKQMLNYEYGYTAVILGGDEAFAKRQLQSYEAHVESLKPHLSEARYWAYMTSVYTYKMALDKVRVLVYAKKLFASIKRAMELDSEDAMVLSMMGNVEFYNPMGNKQKALQYLQKADSIYNIHAEEYEQWNHHAVKMTIEQCKQKINK
jgi:hypothetical protein